MDRPDITLIVARATNGVIGRDGDAGEWTSIALRPGSELPVISYVQREAGNKTRLMLAFCGNADCYDETQAH